MLSINKGYCEMFILMLLVYKGFLPPLLSVLPPGQNRILPGGQKRILPGGQKRILPGGQKQKQGGQKIFSRPSGAILPPLIFFLPPLIFFSAPAKINPAHATAFLYSHYLESIGKHNNSFKCCLFWHMITSLQLHFFS